MSRQEVLRLSFGKYRGEYITRVPVAYLQWMVNQEEMTMGGVDYRKEAQAELERRGGNYDSIMPSLHAIDRFSQKYHNRWNPEEKGIAARVSELADQAWFYGKEVGERQKESTQWIIKKMFNGVTFVYLCNDRGLPHTVKTVI